LQDDENISDDDLTIRHLEKLRKDFKRSQDLEQLHIPKRILTLFDFETENARITSHLQDDLIELSVDLEANHCPEAKASVNTGEMQILPLNTPGLL